MLYREIEVEKYWDIPSTTKNKKEKIHAAILTGAYGATIKKDGEYIRAIYDTDGEIYILGRGTNAKAVHNLNEHLVFLSTWLKEHFKPGTCLLGELYVPGKNSAAIRAYTGSLVPKSLKNQAALPPRYYIFDVWAINGHNMMEYPYSARYNTVDGLSKVQKHPQIDYAKMVTGSSEILDYIATAFENGEEGCVLVKLDSVVTPDKRTAWKTIKVKKQFQNNLDCFFTGRYKEGTKDYTGSEIENWSYWYNIKTGQLINEKKYPEYVAGESIEPITKNYFLGYPGSLEVGVYKGTEIISLCNVSGINDDLKMKFIMDRDSIIMRPIIITGMEATEDKSIRHPKFLGFRDDIDIKECIYEKIFGE